LRRYDDEFAEKWDGPAGMWSAAMSRMSVLLVGRKGTVDLRLTEVPRFEGTVEHIGHSEPHEVSARRLQSMHLVCQNGGPVRSGYDCLECPRFAGWVQRADDEVLVRCCWSEGDPVSKRMTCMPHLVTARPESTVRSAKCSMQRHGIHHLLVVDDAGKLRGIVSSTDLGRDVPTEEPIETFMSHETFALRPDATIGEAAAGMRLFKVGCLPVVADGILVGLLTRTDLEQVGVPMQLLR
jgi:predicted transcriptional regulator